jgi:hypothetical protein
VRRQSDDCLLLVFVVAALQEFSQEIITWLGNATSRRLNNNKWKQYLESIGNTGGLVLGFFPLSGYFS